MLSASPVLGLPFAGGAALIILLGALFAGIKTTELLTGSKALVIMLLVFTLFRIISTGSGIAPAICAFAVPVFNIIQIDLAALKSSLYLAAGILVCFASASLFFAVTTTAEIRNSLSRIELFLFGLFNSKNRLLPKNGRLSLALALMLGFLPRFFECWENADSAARARCCKGGLKRVMVILPLVAERMIEAAAESAEALESRGLAV